MEGKEQIDVFTQLDNVLGNYADGDIDWVTAEDVVKVAHKVNQYLFEHPHPHQNNKFKKDA